MKYYRPFFEGCLLLLLLPGMALLAGCNRGKNNTREIAYVSAPQAFLRDQVGAKAALIDGLDDNVMTYS